MRNWIAPARCNFALRNGRTLQVPQGGRISRQGQRDFLQKRQHVGTRPGGSAHPERVACGCATAIHGSGLPMVSLAPGETYAMDTVWFPVRAGKELSGVSRPGVTGVPLTAKRTSNGIRLTGTSGVFFAGTLQARVFDGRERLVSRKELAPVDRRESIRLENEIKATAAAGHITLHLLDVHGLDRGRLATARVLTPSARP